eukprot:6184690-Pleurochrysis_carterae.AAC.4
MCKTRHRNTPTTGSAAARARTDSGHLNIAWPALHAIMVNTRLLQECQMTIQERVQELKNVGNDTRCHSQYSSAYLWMSQICPIFHGSVLVAASNSQ